MSLIQRNEYNTFAQGELCMDTPNGDLFVVCDGDPQAAAMAAECIINFMLAKRYATPLVALDGALQEANRQMLDHAATPIVSACVLLIQGVGVWIARVGDSSIYLYLGKKKKLHRLTGDHPSDALGTSSLMHPDFNHDGKSIRPQNGDIFLLCGNSLTDRLSDSVIQQVMSEGEMLEEKGARLIELAKPTESNGTGGYHVCPLEMILVDNSPWKKSEFKSFNPAAVANERHNQNPVELVGGKVKLTGRKVKSTGRKVRSGGRRVSASLGKRILGIVHAIKAFIAGIILGIVRAIKAFFIGIFLVTKNVILWISRICRRVVRACLEILRLCLRGITVFLRIFTKKATWIVIAVVMLLLAGGYLFQMLNGSHQQKSAERFEQASRKAREARQEWQQAIADEQAGTISKDQVTLAEVRYLQAQLDSIQAASDIVD